MYIKPSAPILVGQQNTKSLRANKKTGSDSESFRDLLEEIDVVELSPEVNPDEKRKQNSGQEPQTGTPKQELSPQSVKSIDRIV